ncbi:MAG: alpha/beta fold hydrolase [Proteobacteria bacterium]|nr:alpha/beta fold hydrolase [Pseudomonadota bacterium]
MNHALSQPLFIPVSDSALFALSYPSLNPECREAVIICPPDPQDGMRSHGCLVQLARRLQQSGLAVLRFDYRGTGDSEGASNEISLDLCLQDILTAASFMRQQTSCIDLSLIGLRLGASLAIRASKILELKRLVLWDPILDGIDYIKAAERSQHLMFTREKPDPPFPSARYSSEQYWGFPWTKQWRSELASVSLATLQPRAKESHMLLATDDRRTHEAFAAWQAEGLAIKLCKIGEDLHWGDDRYMKFRAFPAAQLRFIQDIFGGTQHG